MNNERLFKVIQGPHISEKSTEAGSNSNQYVFEVAKDSTKSEIKAAVEKLFEVKVENVRVLNVKGKQKTFRQKPGRRSGWRKAYVRIKDGQTIDVLSSESA